MREFDAKQYKKPTQYDLVSSCNKCGGVNDYSVIDAMESIITECKTKCKDCGFEDHWAYGFFESSQGIESKCKKYSFD